MQIRNLISMSRYTGVWRGDVRQSRSRPREDKYNNQVCCSKCAPPHLLNAVIFPLLLLGQLFNCSIIRGNRGTPQRRRFKTLATALMDGSRRPLTFTPTRPICPRRLLDFCAGASSPHRVSQRGNALNVLLFISDAVNFLRAWLGALSTSALWVPNIPLPHAWWLHTDTGLLRS